MGTFEINSDADLRRDRHTKKLPSTLRLPLNGNTSLEKLRKALGKTHSEGFYWVIYDFNPYY